MTQAAQEIQEIITSQLPDGAVIIGIKTEAWTSHCFHGQIHSIKIDGGEFTSRDDAAKTATEIMLKLHGNTPDLPCGDTWMETQFKHSDAMINEGDTWSLFMEFEVLSATARS